jgi:hypothetical protein
MSGLKPLLAAAVISMISATSALAQEPAAFAAQHPDRDVLNGGALTPAGRLGLVLPYGAAPSPSAYAAANAYAGVDGAVPSLQVPRHPTRRRHPAR